MKKINTIALIALLVVSFAVTVAPAIAQSPANPVMGVAWVVEEDSVTQFEHTEEQSNWIFGPQPRIWIAYADNMTDIADNNYRVNVGDELLVDITVPKSFLPTDLDAIQFWGNGRAERAAFFGLEYNVSSDRWNSLAYRYLPGVEEPRPSSFITLDSLSSDFTDSADYYHVVFAITYEQAILPEVFSTGMQVVGIDGRPVATNWLVASNTGAYVSPPIGFGMPIIPTDFSLPNYYYADIVGEDGRILHYADVNDTFTVRMMSNVEVGETLIPFTQLTWDESYHMKANWSTPIGLADSESVLFNQNVVFNETEVDLYPFMALKVNATDAYVIGGYLNLTWDWLDLGGGLGMWFPYLTVIENSTIDLAKYFVLDVGETGIFDGLHRIQWSGYFTNETDLDEGFGFGGTIRPEMSLVTVLDTDGEPIIARPEIRARETMKLSFRMDFIEAFVFNEAGMIADIAQQNEMLNLTMFIHKNSNEINGSFVYEPEPGALFNATQELKYFTLEIKGSFMDANDTHYWRVDITHTIGIDFENDLPIESSLYRVTMYLKGGLQLWSLPVPVDDVAIASYELDMQEDLTTLNIMFSFDTNAPDMVIDNAKVTVGLLSNVRIWDAGNSTWGYPWWLVPAELTLVQYNALVAVWTDQATEVDLSSDTLWSPRHLRLGNIYTYTPPIWTVTEDGAIDLDGNVYTEDDQYFVKRTSYWEDWGNITVSGMYVGVGFDPTPGERGDEFWSENWMGVLEQEMWFNANETFYWYHTDGSAVNASELVDIQDTLWADMSNDIPVPGYEYVSWMAKNRTLDSSQIPTLEDGKWSNTWFAWGTRQTFWVGISETQATLARFRAEYAGLLIFNDGLGPTTSAPDFSLENGQVVSDEVTHLVLIDDVASVVLRRPFGATNDTGNVIVSPDTVVEFGVSIYDVDVTIYPLRVEHSTALRGAWDFRQSYEGVIGLNSTNFDYWITKATVDEMSFDISFEIDTVEYDAEDPTRWNNAVSFKVDQRFGDWTLHDFDNTVLEGRSLAVNFFGVLGTGTGTRYTADDRPVTDTNGASLEASYYEYGDEDSPYASVTMGGLDYTWGGDGHSVVHTSGSSTVPIGAFSAMYESASGSSVANWNVEASMLFMTSGYEYWGGEDIICDPVFVAYTSNYQSSGPTTPYTPGDGDPLTLYLIVGGVVALVVVVCMFYRRR